MNRYWTRDGYLAHYGVTGMKWGIRRAIGALSARIKKNAANRASHPDRRPLETAQRNSDRYMTLRTKAGIAKRKADEADIGIARKHKMIFNNGKAVRKMSNAEMERVLKNPHLQKSLSDLNTKQMTNFRKATAITIGLYGALVVASALTGSTR